MNLGTIGRYRSAFNALKGEHMMVLVETFSESDPLNLLLRSATLTYNIPGVRRASVLKQLRENQTLATYGKLHKAGLVNGPSVEEFLDFVDTTLKQRKKK